MEILQVRDELGLVVDQNLGHFPRLLRVGHEHLLNSIKSTCWEVKKGYAAAAVENGRKKGAKVHTKQQSPRKVHSRKWLAWGWP